MPSQKILAAKQEAVAALAGKMRTASAGVLVKYEGITVEDDTKLRAALRAAGVEYAVMKNSITGRACDEVGFGALKEHLVGMTALAVSQNDPVAPAKVLKKYAEKVETFDIKAGFVDGEILDRVMKSYNHSHLESLGLFYLFLNDFHKKLLPGQNYKGTETLIPALVYIGEHYTEKIPINLLAKICNLM